MPERTLVVENIGELVTCVERDGDILGLVRDAVVVARDGVIAYAGGRAGATIPPDAEHVDAGGNAAIPGFVDCHTHLAWLGDRADEYAARAAGASYADIAAGGGGIRRTVRDTAAGSITEVAGAVAERAQRMLRGGTTTVEVKSGYGIAQDAEMRLLDAISESASMPAMPDVVATWLPLHARPDGDEAAYLDEVCGAGADGAAQRGVAFCDVFCEAGAFDVDACARVLGVAAGRGMRARVHAEQLSHSGGAALAASLQAASADHLDHATGADARALAAAGTVAVLLPGASLTLGGPHPPGRALVEAGCTIAVATDCNPGTCYSESMPLMVSLAVATSGLTPAEAVVAATHGGATALGLADRGVLAAGRRCDLAILATPRWLDIAYHLGASPVATVVRGGEVVVSDAGMAA